MHALELGEESIPELDQLSLRGGTPFNVSPNGQATGHTAWYNAANGSFCVKVPNHGSEDDIQELFHRVNG